MKANTSKNSKYQSGNLILKAEQKLGALVLGDCNSAMDKKIQKQYMIQTVISIGQQAMPLKQKLPQNCKHHFYDIHDNKSQKITPQLFDQVNDIIEKGRKLGGVLVHCYAGVSRSSSFVIAYIMSKDLKNYEIAKQQVKKLRNCICPNDGFINHLKTYWKVLYQKQEQRLRKLEQQKRLQMEGSLIKTARKSVRGGVKSADMSLQKVKEMAQNAKKQKQLVIVPIQDSNEDQVNQENIKNKKQENKNKNVESLKKQSSQKVSPSKTQHISSKQSKSISSTKDVMTLKNQKVKQIVKSESNQPHNTKEINSNNILKNPNKSKTNSLIQTKKVNIIQVKMQDKQKLSKRDKKIDTIKIDQNKNSEKTKNQDKKQKQEEKQMKIIEMKNQLGTDLKVINSVHSVVKKQVLSSTNKNKINHLVNTKQQLSENEKKVKNIYGTKLQVK